MSRGAALRLGERPCVVVFEPVWAFLAPDSTTVQKGHAMAPFLPLLLTASVALGAAADRGTKPAGGGVAGASCGCPGDFDHSGTIDGGDLATLLGGWDSTTTDLDGNGTTDAADLGILLGGWGACDSTPANDLCINSIPLLAGDTPFCTVGADTDGPAFSQSSGCVEFGYNQMTSDVWYVYTAPADGTVTISTCGATWDTRLAAYDNLFGPVVGCPGSDINFNALVACNDDAPGCGNGSEITLFVYGGEEYKIRVGGYQGWSGEGTLHVDFDPVGSSCETAIDLASIQSETYTNTTLDADHDADESPCALGDTAAKWYKFYPSSCFGVPVVTVSTCLPSTDFDTTISVWKADSSGCIGELIGCNDDFADGSCQIGGLNRKSKLTFTAQNGTYYYVRVSGYNGAQGQFGLNILSVCN